MVNKIHPDAVQILIGAGKEIAGEWLNDAVSTAKDPEQMINQVFAMQVAAAHLLATCAFNVERQDGKDGDAWLDETCAQMKLDLEEIRKAHERGEVGWMKSGKLDA